MLISYTFRFSGYNETTKRYEYDKGSINKQHWEIVDTDFNETIIHHPTVMSGSVMDIKPIIETYERRCLQVIPNVIKGMICLNKDRGIGIDSIFNWNKEYNPQFAKYKDDIAKYICLI